MAEQDQQKAKELPVYTYADVAKHNTAESSWCVVHGRVLDLTKFLKKHPGGSQIILASGIDASILVESYHPKGVSEAVLDKMTIGTIEKTASYYQLDNKPEDFYPTLKRRVHEHLKEIGEVRRGTLEIRMKAVVILVSLVVSYVMGWIFPQEHLYMRVFWAVINGIASSHVGMSIMHDANHGAFSTNSTANTLLGWTLDLIGASGCVWSFQHVVSHHAFTNLETQTERNMNDHRNLKSGDAAKDELDLVMSHENDVDAFSSFPLIRMHPADERHWFHKYQHIYAPILFGFFTLGKIFLSDLQFYTSSRVSHVDMTPRMSSFTENFVFLFMKLFNFVQMVAIPTYLLGPQVAALLLFVAHFVAGEYLALCFIVSHISSGCEFYVGGEQMGLEKADKLDEDLKKAEGKKAHPRDWAALQIRSTVNWAPESWFWGAFSGGLNTQAEHHLFPGVSHTNYRHMTPTIRKVCEEYGVKYVEVPHITDALRLCFRYLYDLGHEDLPKSGPQEVTVYH